MSKCRYDLSKDCNNTDCLNCVLDKIRAKIEEQKQREHFDSYDEMFAYKTGLEDTIEIIDKYRAKSEK